MRFGVGSEACQFQVDFRETCRAHLRYTVGSILGSETRSLPIYTAHSAMYEHIVQMYCTTRILPEEEPTT